jgi:hypothetical protein
MPSGQLALCNSFSSSTTNHFSAADTIRILIATDSHVGYEERDPIRKDDSWRSFDEVMQLARTEDASTSHV